MTESRDEHSQGAAASFVLDNVRDDNIRSLSVTRDTAPGGGTYNSRAPSPKCILNF